MGKTTDIAWCDHTFNPWWGCQRVSLGCENCYAESMATRWGMNVWGPAKTIPRRLFGEKHWREPLIWDQQAEEAGVRRRVFCASMADVFEDHPMLIAKREKLWELIRGTPHLDWLLLTKRPENIRRFMPWQIVGWDNVWLGTSAENQEQAEKRIPRLLESRDQAPVLFVSAEPLLGPLDLRWCLEDFEGFTIDWVITGGESGPRHRPFDIEWVRSIDAQCRAVSVAHFFKQHGGRTHAEGGCLINGVEVKQFPNPRETVCVPA